MPDAPHSHRTTSPTRVVELVVNLDDVTPEVIGTAAEALMEAGALDVWTTAISMKRQRPGVMLSLLCEEACRDALARRVIELTGSFGVRMRTWDRLVLQRSFVEAETDWGPITVKLGRLDGRCITVRPEHASVVALAESAQKPLAEAVLIAQAAAAAVLRREQAHP